MESGRRQRDNCKTILHRLCGHMLRGVTGIASTNTIVNPYAQYASHFFQPVVQTSRASKLVLFDACCDVTPPDVLILGSSRVQKFEPRYVEQLTGLRCFNAGVNYGSTEDFLAWFRHYWTKTKRAPKLLLLGIDVAGFSDAARADPRLLGCRPLAHELNDVLNIRDRLQPYRELLDLSQTRQSLRSLILHLRDRVPQPEERYCDDGLLVYDRRERELAEGTYDFEGPLNYTIDEYRHKFCNFGSVSNQQLEVLNKLFQQCEEAGTNVIAFYTTNHPRQLAALRVDAEYDRYSALVDARLRPTCDRYHVRLVDLAEINQYGGDSAEFVDGIHPLESNTRRMLDVILAEGM